MSEWREGMGEEWKPRVDPDTPEPWTVHFPVELGVGPYTLVDLGDGWPPAQGTILRVKDDELGLDFTATVEAVVATRRGWKITFVRTPEA